MDKYGSDKPDLRNPLIMQDALNYLENAILKHLQVSWHQEEVS